MIGNDLVDRHLARSQSHWKRKGWLQKLFTTREQAYIYNAQDSESVVWQLWSRKEATYKAHQRYLEFAPTFNPKAYECDANSTVTISGIPYQTSTVTTINYIHTVANLPQCIPNLTEIRYEVIQKEKANTVFLAQIAKRFGSALQELQIQKNAYHIPELYIGGERIPFSFSLTHHGRYAAYAYWEGMPTTIEKENKKQSPIDFDL